MATSYDPKMWMTPVRARTTTIAITKTTNAMISHHREVVVLPMNLGMNASEADGTTESQ
jgi:hypothetical protein